MWEIITEKETNMLVNNQPTIVGIGGTLRPNSTSLWALERALESAANKGARTDILSMYNLQLPMYEPGRSLKDFGPNVQQLIDAVRQADGLIISTAAYHGSMAGVTKNMFDFFEFLSGGENPYLHNKAVGLIVTAGGTMAGPNTITAMVNVVHSLRGTAVPLAVAIPGASKVFSHGKITDAGWAKRLDEQGKLVVEMVRSLRFRYTYST